MGLTGGTNLSDIIHRIFWKLLAPGLALKFSLAGRSREKRSFRDTVIYKVLIDATRSSGGSGTDKIMDHIISDILKHAGDKLTSRAHVSGTAAG